MANVVEFSISTNLATVVKQPYETDEEFCRRHFNNKEWLCSRCGAVRIHWPGICEACEQDENAKATHSPQTMDERLAQAGVPEQYRGATWETRPEIVNGAEIALELRAWKGQPPVYLCGPAGSGKTCAAVCIAKDGLARNKRVRFLFVPEWLDQMRALERDGGSYQAVEAVAHFFGLVVLDEIGSDRVTDLARDLLLRIVEYRTSHNLPLVATGNLELTSMSGDRTIAAVLDQRIASRLARGLVVHWIGPDNRRRNGQVVGGWGR